MKKPFEVGDRVAVYQSGIRKTGSVFVIAGPFIKVRHTEPDQLDMNYLPQQLRRIGKKKRREIWVDIANKIEGRPGRWTYMDQMDKTWVRFIEAKTRRI